MLSCCRHLRRRAADERGFTLIELLIAMVTSIVVIGALFTILEVSLAQSTKIANETYSDQIARTALTRIVDELHNACIHSEFKPVSEESGKEKTGESALTFTNTYSEAAAPEPKEIYQHRIVWKLESGSTKFGSLTEYVATYTHGTWPEYTEPGTETKVLLASHIAKAESGGKAKPIFTYYRYGTEATLQSGTLSEIALSSGLLPEGTGKEVAAVEINFDAATTTAPSSLERSITLSNRTTFAFSAPNQETPIKDAPCQ